MMLIRVSARLLVMDSEQRVLLLRVVDAAGNNSYREPGSPARNRTFWVTPGGGVESGESLETAARRELFEETGLNVDALGDQIHVREIALENDAGQVLSQEHFFLVRLSGAASISTDHQTELERRDLRGHRWWSLDELEVTAEAVYPENLPGLLRWRLTRSLA